MLILIVWILAVLVVVDDVIILPSVVGQAVATGLVGVARLVVVLLLLLTLSLHVVTVLSNVTLTVPTHLVLVVSTATPAVLTLSQVLNHVLATTAVLLWLLVGTSTPGVGCITDAPFLFGRTVGHQSTGSESNDLVRH